MSVAALTAETFGGVWSKASTTLPAVAGNCLVLSELLFSGESTVTNPLSRLPCAEIPYHGRRRGALQLISAIGLFARLSASSLSRGLRKT